MEFAPVDLVVPEDVKVENVHLSESLLTLVYLWKIIKIVVAYATTIFYFVNKYAIEKKDKNRKRKYAIRKIFEKM